MKVTISAPGKFHAVYLAEYLSKSDSLDKLFISAFGMARRSKHIERGKVVNLLSKTVIQAILSRSNFLGKEFQLGSFVSRIFDWQVQHLIGPTDIFLGWSGFSLLSLRRAKSLGAITILERGSSHIGFQTNILEQEYKTLGLRPCLPEKGIIEKELAEYDEADYVSVPSVFAKNTFLERGFVPGRIICIPYGVDTQVFRRVPKTDNVFRVIFVGSISVRKGVQYLLEAVRRLNLPGLELLLIGSLTADSKPILKKYEGYYKYIGQVDFFNLYKYYSQGSVFVLPSLEEGMAHVILQAMACGLAVICTNNSGGGDVVSDGVEGYVVPIRDADFLMQKINFLYNNRQVAEQMGVQAASKVNNCFTWSDYGRKVLDTYSMLINNRQTRKVR